jgi:hypothetical protein
MSLLQVMPEKSTSARNETLENCAFEANEARLKMARRPKLLPLKTALRPKWEDSKLTETFCPNDALLQKKRPSTTESSNANSPSVN